MYRWLMAAALGFAVATAFAAEQAPTVPFPGTPAQQKASPAAPTAPASGTKSAPAETSAADATKPAAPQIPIVRVPVPLIGQPVVTKTDFAGFSIREVVLTRRRSDTNENIVSARVRVVNTGTKAIEPAFRIILLNGKETLGAIAFPSDHELPTSVAAGATLPWQKSVAIASTKAPDAFAIAPPETVTHEGSGASAAPAGGGKPGGGATFPGAGRPGGGKPGGGNPGGGKPGGGDRRGGGRRGG